MSSPRSRKDEKSYKAYLKTLQPGFCTFCEADREEKLQTGTYFKVVRNQFPYVLWDTQEVVDHLMIVPLAHVDSLGHFSPEMFAEFQQLITQYEPLGYNVYLRAPQSKRKTITHQHTHLIKTVGEAKRLVVVSQSPRFHIAI